MVPVRVSGTGVAVGRSMGIGVEVGAGAAGVQEERMIKKVIITRERILFLISHHKEKLFHMKNTE
jgi:hypothetical protein